MVNILVDDKELKVKLTDFGSAQPIGSRSVSSAPWIHDAGDYFSLGVILFKMLAKEDFWKGNPQDCMRFIEPYTKYRLEWLDKNRDRGTPQEMYMQMRNLIEGLLKEDPNERFPKTLDEESLLNHQQFDDLNKMT